LIKSNIPVNIRNQKKKRRGRPTRFNPESYAKRTSIERFFAWLKMGFRRLASRYEWLNVVSRDCWILRVSCYAGKKYKKEL